MTDRKAPIIQLVPDKYGDLVPFFQAQQEINGKQGAAVDDLDSGASTADIIAKINELLAELRTEGTIDT